MVLPIFMALVSFMLQKWFLYDMSYIWVLPSLALSVYMLRSKMYVYVKRQAKILRAVTHINMNSASVSSKPYIKYTHI